LYSSECEKVSAELRKKFPDARIECTGGVSSRWLTVGRVAITSVLFVVTKILLGFTTGSAFVLSLLVGTVLTSLVVSLIPRSATQLGIFDVYVNNQLVFCKFNEGRFPNPGEILSRIK